MNDSRVLVDAGPLVALLNAKDAAHSICAAIAKDLPRPMLTTWIVLAEAAWLLQRTTEGPLRLLRLVEGGVVACRNWVPKLQPAWLPTF